MIPESIDNQPIEVIKIPFCFPVVYHGLIAAPSKLRNKEKILNTIIYGHPEGEVFPDSNYHHSVKRQYASHVFKGDLPISSEHIETFCTLKENTQLEHIRSLSIAFPQEVVSAFHAYLCSDDCEIDILEWQKERLMKTTLKHDPDPCEYIVEAIKLAFDYQRERNEKWISINPQIKAIEKKLHQLSKSDDYENLYAKSEAERLLAAASKETVAILIDNAIPYLMQRTFAILFQGVNTSPEIQELIEKGDFQGVIESYFDAGRISFWDRHKWLSRRFPILKMAAEILMNSNEKPNTVTIPSDFTENWFIDFIEKAGDVSDEEMRTLWAKVLAGEINHPGSFSQKTLRTLLDLPQRVARHFKTISKMLVYSTFYAEDNPFVFSPVGLVGYYRDINLIYSALYESDINNLIDYGLLLPKISTESRVYFKQTYWRYEIRETVFTNRSETVAICFSKKGDNTDAILKYDRYEVSSVGRELLQLVKEPDDDYLLFLGASYAEMPDLPYEIHVYRVTKKEFRAHVKNSNDYVVPAGKHMMRWFRNEYHIYYDYDERYYLDACLDTEHDLIAGFQLEEEIEKLDYLDLSTLKDTSTDSKQ